MGVIFRAWGQQQPAHVGHRQVDSSLFARLTLATLSPVFVCPNQNAEATRAASGEGRRRKSSAATSSANAAAAAAAVKVEAIARAELEKRVESLERDLTRAGQESRAQSARAASLQRQLDGGGSGGGGGNGRSGSAQGRRGSSSGGGSALGLNGLDVTAEGVATADIMALKIKATQLVERLRQEKAMRLKAERKTQKVAGKVREGEDLLFCSCGCNMNNTDTGPCGLGKIEAGKRQAGRQA